MGICGVLVWAPSPQPFLADPSPGAGDYGVLRSVSLSTALGWAQESSLLSCNKGPTSSASIFTWLRGPPTQEAGSVSAMGGSVATEGLAACTVVVHIRDYADLSLQHLTLQGPCTVDSPDCWHLWGVPRSLSHLP